MTAMLTEAQPSERTSSHLRLAPSQQALIDLRLDTLDRLLVERVSRSVRKNIVSEVESQIFEMLTARQAAEGYTRDDVLSVLALLDPPEAYVPPGAERRSADEGIESREPPHAMLNRAAPPTTVEVATTTKEARYGKWSGMCGLSAVALLAGLPVLFLLAEGFDSETLLFMGLVLSVGVGTLLSIAALMMSGLAKLRGPWPIVGMSCGIITVLAVGIGFLGLAIL